MKRIVVIDSEPTVRNTIATILERAGYSVFATGEFPKAVEALQDAMADLVVTNVFLRGISGHDAMFKLKQTFPKLPVLMVSGLPDEKVIASWTGQAGFDVFPKPFASQELVRKVEEILGSESKRGL